MLFTKQPTLCIQLYTFYFLGEIDDKTLSLVLQNAFTSDKAYVILLLVHLYT